MAARPFPRRLASGRVRVVPGRFTSGGSGPAFLVGRHGMHSRTTDKKAFTVSPSSAFP